MNADTEPALDTLVDDVPEMGERGGDSSHSSLSLWLTARLNGRAVSNALLLLTLLLLATLCGLGGCDVMEAGLEEEGEKGGLAGSDWCETAT